jgi:hypothetical protein
MKKSKQGFPKDLSRQQRKLLQICHQLDSEAIDKIVLKICRESKSEVIEWLTVVMENTVKLPEEEMRKYFHDAIQHYFVVDDLNNDLKKW